MEHPLHVHNQNLGNRLLQVKLSVVVILIIIVGSPAHSSGIDSCPSVHLLFIFVYLGTIFLRDGQSTLRASRKEIKSRRIAISGLRFPVVNDDDNNGLEHLFWIPPNVGSPSSS
jgi:hypothetical protein